MGPVQTPDVAIHVGRQSCHSWACPVCSRRLGWVLENRLTKRFKDCRVILISLTLDRKRWRSPRHAYEHVKRNRLVARAVKDFCDAYSLAYRGMWISKMELQSEGWPHWHVLLEVPESLELPTKGAMDAYWSLGFSNVRHRASAAYITKYACKASDLESRLEASGLPAKGVRWTTASREFWRGLEPDQPAAGDPMYDGPMWSHLESGRYADLVEFERAVASEVPFDIPALDPLELAELTCHEELHVVRVASCGQSARVTIVGCEGGKERVYRQFVVSCPALHVRAELFSRIGAAIDSDLYVLTVAELETVVESLPIPQCEIEAVETYLNGNYRRIGKVPGS